MITDTNTTTYTCVLLDAANHILRSSTGEFRNEAAALRHAATLAFLNDSAASYELWHRLRRVASFTKPGLARA